MNKSLSPSIYGTMSGRPADRLNEKKSELIQTYLENPETDVLVRLAEAFDEYFRENTLRHKPFSKKSPFAIIALGGYGRMEQCFHSDVDLLFLFKSKISKDAEPLVRDMVYPLWDNGFHVGHSTQSLKEWRRVPQQEIETMTAYMDARFICGRRDIFNAFIERFEKSLKRKTAWFIRTLLTNTVERHKCFGDSSYLLEPDLKEGQGGLRDYHTLLWIARAQYRLKDPRDLEFHGLLTNDEYETLTDSLDFIRIVRNRLHLLLNRKFDHLHFEHQEAIANQLGYPSKNGRRPVEHFLADLHGRMSYIKQYLMMFLHEYGFCGKNRKPGVRPDSDSLAGIKIDRNALKFISPETILEDRFVLIRIFEASVDYGLPLSAESKRLIQEFLYLVNDSFRTSHTALQSFERILLMPVRPFNVLHEMLNTGFLKAFIPEFEQIENRIQFNEYHIYPVDKHSLRTVKIIKRFSEDPDFDCEVCKELYEEIIDKNVLLWSALLHDIGKLEPGGGHSEKGAGIARNILALRGYPDTMVNTAAFLVQHHLLLVKTATQRDLEDEETAIQCARTIKTPERLKMLYLLSVADSMATGPKAWNNWIKILLRSLFLKVLNILEKGELATDEAVDAVEEKKAKLIDGSKDAEERRFWETLLQGMSPRYLLYASLDEIREHAEVYNQLGNRPFNWKIKKDRGVDSRTVIISTWDAAGLISKISGVFTLNGIDILDVHVYTWKNRIALDIFKVRPPMDRLFEDEKWAKTEKDLEAALAGEIDIASALDQRDPHPGAQATVLSKPPKIKIDNQASSFFTIVEVVADDFPGLLFRVSDALFRCGLNIWVAKIATVLDQVMDVFYVRDSEGRKADTPEQEKEIRERIERALP